MASREYGGLDKKRKRGSLSQAKKDLETLASGYAPLAVKTLVSIMRRGDTDAARISAAKAILDRAYGKPKQGVEVGVDPENPLADAIRVYLPDNNREAEE